MNATLEKYAPWMLGVLRIVTALVYLEHGTQKLFHFPPMQRFGGAPVRQAAQTASSALSSAVDTASSALSSAAGTVSSMVSSAPPPSAPAAPPEGMPPSMQAIFLVGGLIELIGGIALVLGFLTRPVALIVAGECAVIFWWMHVPRGGIYPISNGGEAAVLFCFTFLYLVFAGPGAFALDNAIFRRKTD